jgi:tetratricopeptide (TPR) repeat protein
MLSPRQSALCIAALTGLAYLGSFGGDFVFDDVPEIALNPALDQLLPPWEAMFRGQKAPARPLPYLSFAIDRAVWGPSPFGYHVTNLAVHVIAALALFDLTRLTLLSPGLRDRFGSRAVALSLVIAGLWAVHPLQTQAVTYVYQRIESMAGMFCLLALAAFARALAAGWSGKWLVASVAACAAAMACKENAVVLPVLLVLYDWFFAPADTAADWRADAWGHRRFYLALVATWLVLAGVLVSQAGEYQEFTAGKRSPLTYALTQPGVIMHYLRLAVLPVGQCLDSSGWPAVERFDAGQLPAYAAIAALVGLSVFGLVRRRPWAWLGVFFLGTLAPTSSVMPVEALVNEHRMYLPLAAVVAALVLGASEFGLLLFRRRPDAPPGENASLGRTGLVAAAIVAAGLMLLTHARNRLYWSKAAIWNDVLAHDPGNYRALWQFATIFDRNGDEAKAFECADRALARKPSCDVYGLLAGVRLAAGDPAGAERRCRRGLELQRAALPADDRAVLCTTGDLATALWLEGKADEAEQLCVASIADMRRVLGADHAVTLRAEQFIAEGLAKRGQHAAAEELARGTLARARQSKGAGDPVAVNAAVTLARVLDAGGNPTAAERLVRQTLDDVIRTKPRRPTSDDGRLVIEATWAEFLEKSGRIDEAVAVRRRVVDTTERLHGRDSVLTASALNKHALAVAAQAAARGDHAKAADIYGRVHAVYREGLGPDHADTLAVAAKLEAALERAKQSAATPAP